MDNMPDEQSNLVSILSAFSALQLRQFDAFLLRTIESKGIRIPISGPDLSTL
jgi:hypothetical protein